MTNNLTVYMEQLDESDRESLRAQLALLLRERARRYTNGESGSIKESAAAMLTESILYTVAEALRGLPRPVEVLRTCPLAELYATGKKRVYRDFSISKHLLRSVLSTAVETPSLAYNDTVHEGLLPFFAQYDPEFAAHETPGSIDYPLHVQISGSGASYLRAYLQALRLENRFCQLFSPQDVDCAMRRVNPRYELLLENLFGGVLKAALANVLLGREPYRLLPMDAADEGFLARLLTAQPDYAMPEAAERLCGKLGICGAMQKYVLDAAGRL